MVEGTDLSSLIPSVEVSEGATIKAKVLDEFVAPEVVVALAHPPHCWFHVCVTPLRRHGRN